MTSNLFLSEKVAPSLDLMTAASMEEVSPSDLGVAPIAMLLFLMRMNMKIMMRRFSQYLVFVEDNIVKKTGGYFLNNIRKSFSKFMLKWW